MCICMERTTCQFPFPTSPAQERNRKKKGNLPKLPSTKAKKPAQKNHHQNDKKMGSVHEALFIKKGLESMCHGEYCK